MPNLPLFSAPALFLLSALTLPAAPAPNNPVGSVTSAEAAHVGTAPVSVGATVYSGDLLSTEDRGMIQVQVAKAQFALGPNSSMRIFRQDNRTVVELERGVITYHAPGAGESIALYALDVRFVPNTSNPASGQIHVRSRCELGAVAIHGNIDVTSGRESKTIEESKSFSVTSEFGIEYRDSWQPVPADYPEFAPDSRYHHSHGHAACVAAFSQARRAPVPAGGTGHFREIIIGIVAIGTVPPIIKALESPDRP